MHLRVLVDGTIDAHEVAGLFERGDVVVEIGIGAGGIGGHGMRPSAKCCFQPNLTTAAIQLLQRSANETQVSIFLSDPPVFIFTGPAGCA
jgi:hypothetical protein